MKRKGDFWSKKRCFRADSITSRTSLTPDVTAERVKKGRSSCEATILARVVLPTPGGPQRMNEGTFPVSKNLRKTPFGPTRCSCPMYSSRERGRRRSARGILGMALRIYGVKIGKNRVFLPIQSGLRNRFYGLRGLRGVSGPFTRIRLSKLFRSSTDEKDLIFARKFLSLSCRRVRPPHDIVV